MAGENTVPLPTMAEEITEGTETVREGFKVVQVRKRMRISSGSSVTDISKEYEEGLHQDRNREAETGPEIKSWTLF